DWSRRRRCADGGDPVVALPFSSLSPGKPGFGGGSSRHEGRTEPRRRPRGRRPMLAVAALALSLLAPLPDLDQEAPFGVSVVERQHRLLLVFGSAVDNAGRGPLVVDARRVGAVMRTWQVVGRRRFALPVALRYVRSETHEHWHFPAFERYE